MTLKEFKAGIGINLRFLDTIDFTPYLKTCEDVHELCLRVESTIDPNIIPKELEGFVFDYLTEDDVAEYLAERYKDNWYFWDEAVVKHYIMWKPKS